MSHTDAEEVAASATKPGGCSRTRHSAHVVTIGPKRVVDDVFVAGVGSRVEVDAGDIVGAGVGVDVGAGIGDIVGVGTGDSVGVDTGDIVGAGVGIVVGDIVESVPTGLNQPQSGAVTRAEWNEAWRYRCR